MSAPIEQIGALEDDGLVHWLDLHRNANTNVWAIHCGGYTIRISRKHVPYVTCVLCAAGMDYWREE